MANNSTGGNNTSRNIIVNVQANTSAANSSVQQLNQNITNIGNNNTINRPFTNLRQELRAATQEAQNMGRQFGTNSQQFAQAAQRVADLRDEIDVANRAVAGFDPGNRFQAFGQMAMNAAGLVQSAAGAMTLLGVNTDTAQEAMARLQAIMAITDGLDRIGDLQDAFNNLTTVIRNNTVFQRANNVITQISTRLMALFTTTVNTTSVSFRVLKTAIAATGIGLLIILIGEAVQAFNEFINAADEAAESAKKWNDYNLKLANEGLAINKKNLENREKIALAEAKSEKETYEIKQKYLRLKGELEQEYFEEVKYLGDEGIDAAHESAQRIKDINVEGTINRINEEKRLTKIQEDAAKERRAKAEAAAKDAKAKAAAAAKEAADKRKEELEELAKIEAESAKNIRYSKMSERQKELADLQTEFEEKKAKYVKYGKDISTITTEYNINRKAIEQRYSAEISELISNVTLNDFDKQRQEIDKRYDEALKSAKNFTEQIMLESARATEQGAVDSEQTNRSNVINAETNLVNTEISNTINDKDTPEVRKAKLEALFEVEKEFREAKLEQELALLANDEEQKKLVLAKYQQEELAAETELTNAKKKLSDEEKEAKISNLQAVGNALGTLSNLIGQQTVAGKALAVAQASIDTFVGANKALAQGGIAGIAAAAAVIATGLINVKKIISTKVPVKGGGGTSAAAPTITTAPVINASATNSSTSVQDVRVTNPQDQVVRAYVSERDLEQSESRRNFFNNVTSI